jgi:hypothetical protein
MEKTISHHIGFSFAFPLIVFGICAIILGVSVVANNPIWGLGLIGAGGFVASSTYGSQIDKARNQYREYSAYFGIKSGAWKPLEKMPFISILSSRSGFRIHSLTDRTTTALRDDFDVCLLNESHRHKVIVQKFKSKVEALEYAKVLSEKLDIPYANYSPKMSEKTRNRR